LGKEDRVTETSGVTVELLGTVDLGPQIEGMEGRQLRVRMVTIDPGGVFGPIHDHRDRPGSGTRTGLPATRSRRATRSNGCARRACRSSAPPTPTAATSNATCPVIRHVNNLESVLTYDGTHEVHTLVVGQV
jgi:hypothetical protein